MASHRHSDSRLVKNATMLLGLNVAKLVLPFISLPYLTRILTTDTYGTVAYIKSVIGYMQVLVDFGFMLSGTKDVVECLHDSKKLNETVGAIVLARALVSAFAFLVLLALVFALPILRENKLFALLSFMPVFLSVFLFDFVFRGMEKMHVITIRFVVMKGLSTVLVFFIIKDDADIIKMPVIDTISSCAAVGLIFFSLKKEHVLPRFASFSEVLHKLRDSALYFLSSVAAQSFNALNTIVAGIFLLKTEVAYWAVCMQIIGTVQIFYTPLTDGIYPEMIRTKNIKLIQKCIGIFMPVILAGCVAAYFLAGFGLRLVAGEQYVAASPVFRLLIPVLLFSFFAMMLGWPALGALGKVREVTATTVCAIVFQLVGFGVLLGLGRFSLTAIAVLRTLTEFVIFMLRLGFCIRFRKEFRR